MTSLKSRPYRILEDIPSMMNEVEIMTYLNNKKVDGHYIQAIKKLTDFSDDVLSNWLNISTRTFRNYKKPDASLKENTKEQLVLLMSLIKHGLEVFGGKEEFEDWLEAPNFFLDHKKPISLLNTVSGIRFVDSRLSAMEYGDNV